MHFKRFRTQDAKELFTELKNQDQKILNQSFLENLEESDPLSKFDQLCNDYLFYSNALSARFYDGVSSTSGSGVGVFSVGSGDCEFFMMRCLNGLTQRS